MRAKSACPVLRSRQDHASETHWLAIRPVMGWDDGTHIRHSPPFPIYPVMLLDDRMYRHYKQSSDESQNAPESSAAREGTTAATPSPLARSRMCESPVRQ